MTDEQHKERVRSAEGVCSPGEPAAADGNCEESAAHEARDAGDSAADGGDAAAREVEAPDLEELRRKAAERDAFLDELRRTRADMENYQKRTRRERPYWEEQAVGKVLADLLTVLDNFERALESIRADDDRTRSIEQGVRMIYQMMMRVLQEHGVEEIPATGTFDPAIHQALIEETVEDRPTGEITSVLEKGYRFRTSVLRPSKVKVARNVRDTAGVRATDEDAAGETDRE